MLVKDAAQLIVFTTNSLRKVDVQKDLNTPLMTYSQTTGLARVPLPLVGLRAGLSLPLSLPLTATRRRREKMPRGSLTPVSQQQPPTDSEPWVTG